jgi:predicted dehydrogenase
VSLAPRLAAAVIGAGWGERYVSALVRRPDVDVVSVCAGHESSARRVALTYAVPRWYSDYASMLETEKPDVVVIATPNDLHFPIAMLALEHGAHVMCEKPLALDATQAEAMVEKARRLGRTTIVPFTWRFFPGALALRELIDAGTLGALSNARISYLTRGLGDVHGEARWQHDVTRAGSGVLANLGSHAISLVHWLLGDVRSVSGIGRSVIDQRLDSSGMLVPTPIDDAFSLLAELRDGTPVTIETGWVAFVHRVHLEITVFGSSASIQLRVDSGDPDTRVGRLTYGDATLAQPKVLPIPARLLANQCWDDFASASSERIVSEFIGAVLEGRAASPDFTDGLRVQRVMDAALVSAETRQWMNVTAP